MSIKPIIMQASIFHQSDCNLSPSPSYSMFLLSHCSTPLPRSQSLRLCLSRLRPDSLFHPCSTSVSSQSLLLLSLVSEAFCIFLFFNLSLFLSPLLCHLIPFCPPQMSLSLSGFQYHRIFFSFHVSFKKCFPTG